MWRYYSKWRNIFQYLKNHLKFKQLPINMKNYTGHPHDMVHIPMWLRVAVQKQNVTDRQTDGGCFNISRHRPSARREIKSACIVTIHCAHGTSSIITTRMLRWHCVHVSVQDIIKHSTICFGLKYSCTCCVCYEMYTDDNMELIGHDSLAKCISWKLNLYLCRENNSTMQWGLLYN